MEIFIVLSSMLLMFPVTYQEKWCVFPPDWRGVWHHLGYDTPHNVSFNEIFNKDGTSTCFHKVTERQGEQGTFGKFILQEER